MKNALVSIGSNIEPEENIQIALNLLERDEKLTIIKKAEWIRTAPVDVSYPQPDFINTGCLLETELSCDELNQKLKAIESKMGRKPNSTKDPRVIDLDLLTWHNKIIDDDIQNRDFLQKILKQLQPSLYREHKEHQEDKKYKDV